MVISGYYSPGEMLITLFYRLGRERAPHHVGDRAGEVMAHRNSFVCPTLPNWIPFPPQVTLWGHPMGFKLWTCYLQAKLL